MMGLLRLAAVAAFLVTAALLNAGQTSVTTWINAPDPTGIMEGDPLAMMGDIGNWWTRELQDFDTRTVATLASGSCTTSESLILDEGYENSIWLLFDKGRGGAAIEFKGLAFEYSPLSSWVWNTEGDGDYGSSAPATATFWFDDGRAESDPRHDFKRLGGHTVTKLIPDTVYTSYEGCRLNPFTNKPSAYLFDHKVEHHEHPDFSFEGLGVREAITAVFCPDDTCDPSVTSALNERATGHWTVGEDNRLRPYCDQHWPGEILFGPMQNNAYVIVLQKYQITELDWLSKNENHGIGQSKGFSGLLSGTQILKYWFHDPENTGSTACMIMEKNGLGPGNCDDSCSDNVDFSVCPTPDSEVPIQDKVHAPT